MIIPAVKNLRATIGLTFLPVAFDLADANGDPVDLTGYSAMAHVRMNPASPLLVDLDPQITDPEAGRITISHPGEATDTWPTVSARWDLILVNPAGDRLGPYVAGAFVASRILTQPDYA